MVFIFAIFFLSIYSVDELTPAVILLKEIGNFGGQNGFRPTLLAFDFHLR